MTLPEHALQYQKCTKNELRAFVMQRQNLSGREFKKSSKKDLVRRLLRLDQIAIFRVLDLPPEIREQCFKNAVARPSDFRRLLLVSRQVHSEVRWLFYKVATFDIGFVRPRCPSRFSGNPMFGMCTRYWNQTSIHGNLFRVSLAKTFYLQHRMFRNIRHLSLRGEMLEIEKYGTNGRPFWTGASRLLFLTCVFYAFNDLPTQLKTLTYHVEGHRAPSMLTKAGLHSTFWPLKLLAGRVQVEFRSMRKELVNRINLRENDLDSEVIEACRRFARCYFSHERPSVGKARLLELTRADIYREKMAELAAYNIPFLPNEIHRLIDLVKRMEWMEAEYLDHAEEQRYWSLTRAWVKANGSPPRRG